MEKGGVTESGAEMGRRPEKSSFSLTCSLLSQYIKEKGSLVDLGLGMPARSLDTALIGKSEAYRPPTTMNLLPGVEVADETLGQSNDDGADRNTSRSMEFFPQRAGFGPISSPAEAKKPEKNQLTIFYGGKVLVFDNFPAEKANDLIMFASKGCKTTAATGAAKPAPAPAKPPASIPARAQPNFSNLPIARKASLHRFLEKRKDRITAKAPYQLCSSSNSKDAQAVKQEEICQPWLGLGPTSKPGGMISDCSR